MVGSTVVTSMSHREQKNVLIKPFKNDVFVITLSLTSVLRTRP